MLTEMQNTTGPTKASISVANPVGVVVGDLDRSGESVSTPKTIAVHGHGESLRYLLRHLSASWSSKTEACKQLARSPVEQQEL
jgi:hypothetical protein